jgi:hypothetical protein
VAFGKTDFWTKKLSSSPSDSMKSSKESPVSFTPITVKQCEVGVAGIICENIKDIIDHIYFN